MKKLIGILLAIGVGYLAAGVAQAAESKDKEAPLYQFKALTIDGKETTLSQYSGQVMLIVNVASKCGHTPQYKGLEKLYEKYKDKGFVVLGFPCNQFLSQEPGTEKEIKAFCESKYGVTFPLFGKIEVNGPHTHPLYQYLKKTLPDASGKKDISWNFTKFLIDRNGRPIKRFEPSVNPEDFETKIQTAVNR